MDINWLNVKSTTRGRKTGAEQEQNYERQRNLTSKKDENGEKLKVRHNELKHYIFAVSHFCTMSHELGMF